MITLQDIFLFDFGMGVDRTAGSTATSVDRHPAKFAEKLADLGIRLGPEVFAHEQFVKRSA